MQEALPIRNTAALADSQTSMDGEGPLRIRTVESSEILILDSGLRVRLLGVRENPARSAEACEFLRRITADQSVFMKEDKQKLSNSGEPMVYLYLEDGRFINALLVKYDLVDVDEDTPFRYRERFLKRQRDNRAQG